MKKRFVVTCVIIAATVIVVLVGYRFYLHRRIESEFARIKSGGREAAEAVYALGKLGRVAIPRLADMLNSEDTGVRYAAIDALGYIGPPAKPAVPAMIEMLKDKDEAGRAEYERHAYGIAPLGRIGPDAEAAVPFLSELLDHESSAVRVYAAEALWKINRHPRAIPTLVAVIEDRDLGLEGGRIEASYALEIIGPDAKVAVPALIEALTEDAFGGNAASALSKLGPDSDAIPTILDALARVRTFGRDRITAILDKIGPEAEELVQRHIAAIKDKDPGGSLWATGFLIKAAPEDVAAVPALTRALEDENSDVRAWAAAALIKIGPAAKDAVPALTKAKDDSEERVRWRAAMALDVLRQEPSPMERPSPASHTKSRVSPEIVWATSLGVVVVGTAFLYGFSLSRRCPRFRMKRTDLVLFVLILAVGVPSFYLWHLATIREFPFSVGFTMFDLKYGNRSVRRTVSDRMDLNRPDLCVEGLKTRLLESPYGPISTIGLWTVITRREGRSTEWLARQAVPVLGEALRHDDGQVREMAATALGSFGEDAQEAVPALTAALADWSANRAAAVALAKIGPSAEAAIPALLELREDTDRSVARYALIALAKLEPGNHPAQEAVPELIETLKGADFQARITKWDAILALGWIGPDAKSAIPALTDVSQNDMTEAYRKAAAEALKKTQPADNAEKGEL